MRYLSIRRPSPAMLVALVALVSSFAGPALADQAVEVAKKAKLINGSKIKTRSIGGSKLKNNTLTGKQVAESKLGKVPKAKQADTATTAGSAATAVTAGTATTAGSVGGIQVQKILAAVPLGGAATLVSLNGFSLEAGCSAGGVQSLTAGTTRNSTEVQYAHTNGANDPVGGRASINAGATFDVAEGADNGSGTFTWGTTDGNTLTVVLSYDAGGTFGTFTGCAFVGSATG